MEELFDFRHFSIYFVETQTKFSSINVSAPAGLVGELICIAYFANFAIRAVM